VVTHPIFMLTQDDRTVADPLAVWRAVESTGLRYAGVKDVGTDWATFAAFVDSLHDCGCEAMLEIVNDDPEAELAAARAGIEAGVDCLLGGTQVERVAELVGDRRVRYFPFAGTVGGHPVELHGEPEQIAADAAALVARENIAGVDLLAYRHPTDPERVIEATVAAIDAPVIVAGSIDSPARARRVAELGAWGLTVGTAILAGTFAPDAEGLRGQVEALIDSIDDAG
jgi:Putative N-acetylmannosamine-6-phosphate epimerase